MLDTVKVDIDQTFSNIEFRAATAKTQYVAQGNTPGPQKFNKDGVPIWAVRVLAESSRGNNVREELLTISVPLQVNPAEKLQRGDSVALPGLTFGVTPKRDGSGFTTWLSAEGIESVGRPKPHAAPEA